MLEKITLPIEIFIVGKEKSSGINPNASVKLNYIEKMTPKSLSEFYSDKDVFLSLNKYETFQFPPPKRCGRISPDCNRRNGDVKVYLARRNGYG
jgi:hypothetical protein